MHGSVEVIVPKRFTPLSLPNFQDEDVFDSIRPKRKKVIFDDKEKEEKADSVFRSFDKDKDGFLSKEELKEAF